MLTPQEVAEKHLTAVKGGDPSQMAEDYADDAVLVRGNVSIQEKKKYLSTSMEFPKG